MYQWQTNARGSSSSSSSSSFLGTAGNSLGTRHPGAPFTTKDRDNDWYRSNCAFYGKGAWWYEKCYNSNLNGLYLAGQDSHEGMVWWHWKRNHYSVKRSEMKIRPKDF